MRVFVLCGVDAQLIFPHNRKELVCQASAQMSVSHTHSHKGNKNSTNKKTRTYFKNCGALRRTLYVLRVRICAIEEPTHTHTRARIYLSPRLPGLSDYIYIWRLGGGVLERATGFSAARILFQTASSCRHQRWLMMLARDDDDDVTARANAKSIYSCGADMYNCAYTRVCVYKDQSPHLGIRQD